MHYLKIGSPLPKEVVRILSREQLRKELAAYEVERMCDRYDEECGECVTRKATDKEMQKQGRKDPLEIKTYLDHSHHWWKDTEDKMYGKKN